MARIRRRHGSNISNNVSNDPILYRILDQISDRTLGAKEDAYGAAEGQPAHSHPPGLSLLAQLHFPGRPQPPLWLGRLSHPLLLCR